MKTFKCLLFGLLILGTTITAKAQTEKGNFLIGGQTLLNFSFDNSKWKSDNDDGKNYKRTNFMFSPKVGIFVVKGFAIGVELPVSYYNTKYESDTKYRATSLGLGPFLRYYFGSSKIKPYIHDNFAFGYYTSKNEHSSGSIFENKYVFFSGKIGGGVGFFVNEKVSIDLGLTYSYEYDISTEDNDDGRIDIINGIDLEIGVMVVL